VAGAKQRGSALHWQAARAAADIREKIASRANRLRHFYHGSQNCFNPRVLPSGLTPSGTSPLIEVARCQLPRGKPRSARHSKNRRGVIAGARLFSPGATGL